MGNRTEYGSGKTKTQKIEQRKDRKMAQHEG